LNCVHHWLFQLLLFFPICSTFCFPWLCIIEQLFFSYFTSCGNINIHHIHICSDCLFFNNRLNLYYYHNFPMKHFLHFNKLWTICHFMSIQTIHVACIWRSLLWFLTWLCCFCDYHYGLFFFFSTCLHIVFRDPTIWVMFVILLCITLCFYQCCLFGTMWYWQHSLFLQ
jgi:hypothetical protein